MKSHGLWHGTTREQVVKWGTRFGFITLAFTWLALMAASWAEADVDRAPAAENSEYSFNWLDPEKKIYVLQNRKFTKAGSLLASITAGVGLNNAYRDTYNLDPRVAYYFSEMFGVEAFYTFMSNVENSTFNALTQATGTSALPEVREIRSRYGLLAHYVPWYAKINVFNQIIYFDWYFTAGAGQVKTAVDSRATGKSPASFSNEDLFSIFYGTGHQYHLSRSLTIRADFTSAVYNATYIRNVPTEKAWFSNYTFGIGLGLRL